MTYTVATREGLTSWHRSNVGRMDKLVHGGVEIKLMHGVIGTTDKLRYGGGVKRVEKLTLRQHRESRQSDTGVSFKGRLARSEYVGGCDCSRVLAGRQRWSY